MGRFFASTCGVAVEVATLDAGAPVWVVGMTAAGLLGAMTLWWLDLNPLVDRLVGLDLESTVRYDERLSQN